MTRRERAQVVELLRCAADLEPQYRGASMCYATDFCRPTEGVTNRQLLQWERVRDAAWKARRLVLGSMFLKQTDDYQEHLLEAAARVEEGSWP